MGGYRWYILVFVHPLLVASSLYVFSWLWSVSGILPWFYTNLMFSDTWSVQTAAFCCGFSVIPLVLMVTSLMLARMFTSAVNVLRDKQALYFEVTQRVLNNTLEQNFLFVVGLVGASSFYLLTIERMFFLTSMFIVSRLLFWLTYLISAYTGWQAIRGIPFWYTLFNNLLLITYTFVTAYLVAEQSIKP